MDRSISRGSRSKRPSLQRLAVPMNKRRQGCKHAEPTTTKFLAAASHHQLLAATPISNL